MITPQVRGEQEVKRESEQRKDEDVGSAEVFHAVILMRRAGRPRSAM